MPNFWVKSYSKIKENPKATLVKNLYHLRKSLPKNETSPFRGHNL